MIEKLRFALACVWTELEKDNPNLAHCQIIIDEALAESVEFAVAKNLRNGETGLLAWRKYE